jgi:hypothetical protein
MHDDGAMHDDRPVHGHRAVLHDDVAAVAMAVGMAATVVARAAVGECRGRQGEGCAEDGDRGG